MKQTLAIFIFIMVGISEAHAQKSDTTKTVDHMAIDLNKMPKRTNISNASYSKFIIPTVMISYGIITRGSRLLQELDHSTNREIIEHGFTRKRIDDYSQLAPAIAVYGLDFAGIKARHNFRDRTIVMATSYIIMGATVQTMKNTVNVERPDGSNNKSFPSGHTATAFVGAHILFKEYKDASPWIGIAGYAVATGTGALRVLNKKHWVSDVATGAGIGILSAEVGYLLLPVFHDMFGVKNKNNSLVVAPAIGAGDYGIGMIYTF
jgi:Membrane-associated phospholipid phosphatase